MILKNKRRVLQGLTILVILILLVTAIPTNTIAKPNKPPKNIRHTSTTGKTDKMDDQEVNWGKKYKGSILGVDDTNHDGNITVCDDVKIIWKQPKDIYDQTMWYHVKKVTKVSTGDPTYPWLYIIILKHKKV